MVGRKGIGLFTLKLTGLIVLLLLLAQGVLRAETFTVTNLNDSGPGSLRQAILNSNSTPGVDDDIVFDESLNGTILITPANGQMTITDSVNIKGPGPDIITIDADATSANDSRIFVIDGSDTSVILASIQGLSLINGNAGGGNGGAILNLDDMIIDSCLFQNNMAENGGAVHSEGGMIISQSTFEMNTAVSQGGAIYNDSIGVIDSILTTEFSMNSASLGGAIVNQGQISELSSSDFNKNTAAQGGAIFNWDGTVNIALSTFGMNESDGPGGAVKLNSGSMNFENCEISGNLSFGGEGGGGISASGGELTVKQCSFINNFSDGDGGGLLIFNNGGANSVENTTFSGNSARSGGGIAVVRRIVFAVNENPAPSSLDVMNVTLVGNSSENSQFELDAGGIAVIGDRSGGGLTEWKSTLNIKNTLLANNTGFLPNCQNVNNTAAGTEDPLTNIVNDLGGNLSDSDADGDFCAPHFNADFNPDTMLGPLQDNGGFAPTIALIFSDTDPNPALGGGTSDCLATDQRLFGRLPPNCDIGAFELRDAGKITVNKTAFSSIPISYAFSGSGEQKDNFESYDDFICSINGDFNMADGITESCILPEGTFTVQETLPDNYRVEVECTGPATGDSDNAKADMTIESDKQAECTFMNIKQVTLSIALKGTGGGTVTSADGGLNCGGDCDEVYDFETTVELTATPDGTSFFSGWSGGIDCSGGDPNLSTTVKESRTCTAAFTQDPAITVNKSGNGDGTISSSPGVNPMAGIECGPGCTTGSAEFEELSMVQLMAVPDESSEFTGWSGDCSGMSQSIMITADDSKSCGAEFVLKQFPLNITLSGNGEGNVAGPVGLGDGIDCGNGSTNCDETHIASTKVTLTASPASDSTFTGWGGDCASAGKNLMATITIYDASACTANFTLEQFNVNVLRVGSGSGSVMYSPGGAVCPGNCSEAFDINTTVTLTPLPGAFSFFSGWSGPADCADGIIQNLTTDITCSAAFMKDITQPIDVADVSVIKSVSQNEVEVGQEHTYSFLVKNDGPDIAPDVKLIDVLPESLTFISGSDECVYEGVSVVCDIGHLAPGAATSVSVVAIPSQAGAVTNSASVGSGATDPNTANNVSTITIQVTDQVPEFLSVEPESDEITTGPGGMVSISVDITNPSATETNSFIQTKQTVSGLVFMVEFPEGFSEEELFSTNGECQMETNECVIGNIDPGGVVTVVVEALAPELEGLFDIDFSVMTSMGETFHGSTTVVVTTNGSVLSTQDGSSCSLSSGGSSQMSSYAELLMILLMPIVVSTLRRIKRMNTIS